MVVLTTCISVAHRQPHLPAERLDTNLRQIPNQSYSNCSPLFTKKKGRELNALPRGAPRSARGRRHAKPRPIGRVLRRLLSQVKFRGFLAGPSRCDAKLFCSVYVMRLVSKMSKPLLPGFRFHGNPAPKIVVSCASGRRKFAAVAQRGRSCHTRGGCGDSPSIACWWLQ
jgi:hypothetical protein